jgi:hypothetical protein
VQHTKKVSEMLNGHGFHGEKRRELIAEVLKVRMATACRRELDGHGSLDEFMAIASYLTERQANSTLIRRFIKLIENMSHAAV